MSSTLFKAIPGQTAVQIPLVGEGVRFIGNDVESIQIDELDYGSVLTLEESDSLNEIIIKSHGAILSFPTYPKQTIRIQGPIEEIRVYEKNVGYMLHRVTSHPTLPLEQLWGAVITREPQVDCEEYDALMIYPHQVDNLKIEGDWSQIAIIGDKHLTCVEVEGSRVIRDFVIHKGSSLSKLNIRRRVLNCSVLKCPSIKTIVGFGDRLHIQPKPRNNNSLSVGGFWHSAPLWYDEQIAMLRVPHFDAHLSANEIMECEDMGGITVIPHTYDGSGGLCQFSDVFKMAIDDLSFGIMIPDLVKMIEERPKHGIKVLAEWCANSLSRFDQYKAMRIIASLISRGFDQSAILKIRNDLSKMNKAMPMLTTETVNDVAFRIQGGKWKPLYFNEKSSNDELFEGWHSPLNSVMPFGRIDLEIWLNTDLKWEYLGIDSDTMLLQNHFVGRRQLGKNPVIRNLLISTLSAANTVGRNDDAEKKLTMLAQSLYTNPRITSDPFCCEFTIYHLGVSRIAEAGPELIRQFIDGIIEMRAKAWIRATLLIGVVDQINSPRARMALQRLAADPEFSISESTAINAVAIAGKRAFESGKVPKPTWPYLKNRILRNY